MSSTSLGPEQSSGSIIGEFFTRRIDPWLLLLVILISAVGLLTLYSASDRSMSAVINQAERIALGFAVMLSLAQLPPDTFRKAAPWLYGIALVLLLSVLVLGQHAKGAQRWLDLGGFRFQPAELMKLGMPLMVAAFLHQRPLPPNWLITLAVLGLIAVPAAMIAVQPDLGTSMLVLLAGMIALFFGGLRWRWLIGGFALVLAVAPVIWYHLHGYQKQRLMIFLHPESDPLGAGYHIIQSKIAVGSGGLFGEGYLQGTQAKLDFLPEAHTDFIFSVYSEEMGLVGALVLLFLYLAVVIRGLVIAMRGQDTFQRLTAISLSLTFFFYAFINMGMVIGLLPVVGVPLPLVSYGGTSVVSLLAGFGILMSIQTHRKLLTN